MEPEQFKTLREKITTLEHQPVSWQKEFVWQQVALKAGGQPLVPRWSYAAALVVMGMIGYFMFYQQRNRDAIASRISFLEKEIENKTVINQNNKEEACVEEKNNNNVTASSNRITKNPVLADDQPILKQELLAINISDSLITSMAIPEVNSVEEAPQLKTIVPIMGKIPQSIPDPSGKERTVRIRLHRKDNPEVPTSQEGQHVLVARIN